MIMMLKQKKTMRTLNKYTVIHRFANRHRWALLLHSTVLILQFSYLLLASFTYLQILALVEASILRQKKQIKIILEMKRFLKLEKRLNCKSRPLPQRLMIFGQQRKMFVYLFLKKVSIKKRIDRFRLLNYPIL